MQHEIKRLILFPDEANLVGNFSVESVALTIGNWSYIAGQPHQNRAIFGLWMYKIIFLR